MNLAVPFGFYGAGNIGDESTLQGFARLARGYDPDLRVWVGSANPSHTARVEPLFRYFNNVGFDPRRWWVKHRASAHVFAGGTPIMDLDDGWPLTVVGALAAAARASDKPVAFVGIGCENLLSQRAKSLVSGILASGVAHWSVRSERDKERLGACGARPESVTVAADLAWLLDPETIDFGKQYLRRLGLADDAAYVGVNLNSESFMLEQEPRLFEKLAGFLDALIERYGFRVLFLCNEVREDDMFDKATSLKILASMRRRESAFLVPNEYFTPQQMLSLIGCCRFTVSTRYHFCIFSVLQKVPFMAVERSDKVADLCWDMPWRYGTSLPGIDVAQLTDAFSEMEQRRADLKTQLGNHARDMGERALRNRIALEAITLQ